MLHRKMRRLAADIRIPDGSSRPSRARDPGPVAALIADRAARRFQ